ncbi:dipeptidyl aminopeptidase/acylaminoacyl peptidase [Luteibacter jiangsuensis]|uniref:Dipeptidyl aminopeptidase/acylaminoacyl peptidase n=1 Tax=Luteibacter jiangsuensis TaxID=637577 RepID=A0ABT9T1Y1_9GAMM|nr:S9 family peptidase [Luteibacter jiangsuensis]MDQ0010182.1 dipeptidyl aminopeptidase/acylaminoacyl peptidase [Luteibacter jiangsuensis]
MKPLLAALALALASGPVLSADADSTTPHPFSVRDLVMMDRVGDPQLSPDGRYALFSVRATDYAANKGITSLYIVDLNKPPQPVMVVEKGSSPRWASDGKSIYYTAPKDGTAQVWHRSFDADNSGKGLALTVRAGEAVTDAPLDVNAFKLSPDGAKLLLSYDVFTDCPDLACTKERLDGREKDKSTGTVYDKLFVRHWDTWADGRRSQLYIADANAPSQPVLLSRDIDGDVPSKPFGGDDEFSFSPDGKTVYFDARIAGKTEPWSTNFDIYSVPADGSAAPVNLTAENQAWDANPLVSPDGKTLFYTAMKEPGSEADRFGIMALDLASGSKREVAPSWDSSAGALQVSADGKTLYTTTDDKGQHPLFAIDVATGKATILVTDGSVGAFSTGSSKILLSRDDLKRPADLYTADLKGKGLKQVTHFNAKRIKGAQTGDFEFFTFKGWNNETVQGYVVKPVGYKRGKTYPVAFIIHGGPQGAMTNSWSYRWNAQTYAGQGFAVVTVNFHGSTGYGQAFTGSISGDWGGKPLEDLKAGWSAALSKYNFLDGNRACALGASYGGYMVYWMAGNWNQPWKCFVDHDGVFDARAMYYETEELWFEEKENGGTQFDHPENYERFNPVNHVKDWRVPMLVIHSGKDFRIPDTQGLGAFTALQRRGIPSQLLHFPDENHWVLKPQNSVQWHETVNAWLKEWTAPGAK